MVKGFPRLGRGVRWRRNFDGRLPFLRTSQIRTLRQEATDSLPCSLFIEADLGQRVGKTIRIRDSYAVVPISRRVGKVEPMGKRPADCRRSVRNKKRSPCVSIITCRDDNAADGLHEPVIGIADVGRELEQIDLLGIPHSKIDGEMILRIIDRKGRVGIGRNVRERRCRRVPAVGNGRPGHADCHCRNLFVQVQSVENVGEFLPRAAVVRYESIIPERCCSGACNGKIARRTGIPPADTGSAGQCRKPVDRSETWEEAQDSFFSSDVWKK